MRKYIFLSILMTVCLLSFGQQTNNNGIKRVSITDYYIHTGGFTTQFLKGSLADFQLLAPNSVLLNKYGGTFPNSDSYAFLDRSNSMFSVLLGLKFSDKQKTRYKNNMQLRIGISYYSNTHLSYGMNSSVKIPFDTLTSSQTGETMYIDSVISRTLEMNYNSEQLRIDGSLIFRTNPEARWSLYSGIGLSAGMSFNAKTYIFYSKMSQIQGREPFHYSNYNNNYDETSESEVITNNTNFGFSAYIPLGIDFRIGKKREFWKRIHLFYEIRPSINITYIPNLRTITNTAVQHGVGCKISM